MRKIIVTTTINPPTEAIRRFERMKDWELVVIGDKKTPKPYRLKRGIYVSPEEQEKYDKPLSDAIGWNCIQRRSFGLLWLIADLNDSVTEVRSPFQIAEPGMKHADDLPVQRLECRALEALMLPDRLE